MSTAPSDILIVTTESIQGKTCIPFTPILVAYCLSKSLLGDMAANVKNWTTGGEGTDQNPAIHLYTRKRACPEARSARGPGGVR